MRVGIVSLRETTTLCTLPPRSLIRILRMLFALKTVLKLQMRFPQNFVSLKSHLDFLFLNRCVQHVMCITLVILLRLVQIGFSISLFVPKNFFLKKTPRKFEMTVIIFLKCNEKKHMIINGFVFCIVNISVFLTHSSLIFSLFFLLLLLY